MSDADLLELVRGRGTVSVESLAGAQQAAALSLVQQGELSIVEHRGLSAHQRRARLDDYHASRHARARHALESDPRLRAIVGAAAGRFAAELCSGCPQIDVARALRSNAHLVADLQRDARGEPLRGEPTRARALLRGILEADQARSLELGARYEDPLPPVTLTLASSP